MLEDCIEEYGTTRGLAVYFSELAVCESGNRDALADIMYDILVDYIDE